MTRGRYATIFFLTCFLVGGGFVSAQTRIEIGVVANNGCKVGVDNKDLDFSCKAYGRNKANTNYCGLEARCGGSQEIGGKSVIIKGYCEAYAKCKATSYVDADGKEHSVDTPDAPVDTSKNQLPIPGSSSGSGSTPVDPAKQPPSDLSKNNPVQQSVNTPMGDLGKNTQSVLSNVFSGSDFKTPSLYDAYGAQPLFDTQIANIQPIPDTGYSTLPQPGITHDFGNPTWLSSSEPVYSGGEDTQPPQTYAPSAQSTGFESPGHTQPPVTSHEPQFTSPIGTVPGTSPSVSSASDNTPAQNPWTVPPASTPAAPSPTLAPIDSAYEPQSKFNAAWNPYTAQTGWSGAAPTEYPFLAADKIASGQLGALAEAQTKSPQSDQTAPAGQIRVPQDIASTVTPDAFKNGGAIESGVPAIGLNGGWAFADSGVGPIWYGNVSAINGNGTNIGWEYDPSGAFVHFGPTGAQLAQSEGENVPLPAERPDIPELPRTSIAVETPPTSPETFTEPDTVGEKPSPSASTQTADGDLPVNLTGYFPCKNAAACPIQGGSGSSRPGLDGKSQVRTLDDYRLGKAEYVTGASDPSRYGQTYEIPKITYTSPRDGKTYTLENVPIYVHDTGGAFKDRPDKLDIAVGSVGTEKQATSWAGRQQFLNNEPTRLALATNPTGTPTASDAPPIGAALRAAPKAVSASPGAAAGLPVTANIPLPIPDPQTGTPTTYTGSSVTEYFKSIGQDPSYAFRKQVALSYGIKGFRGTASQNLQLLRLMRGL